MNREVHPQCALAADDGQGTEPCSRAGGSDIRQLALWQQRAGKLEYLERMVAAQQLSRTSGWRTFGSRVTAIQEPRERPHRIRYAKTARPHAGKQQGDELRRAPHRDGAH